MELPFWVKLIHIGYETSLFPAGLPAVSGREGRLTLLNKLSALSAAQFSPHFPIRRDFQSVPKTTLEPTAALHRKTAI